MDVSHPLCHMASRCGVALYTLPKVLLNKRERSDHYGLLPTSTRRDIFKYLKLLIVSSLYFYKLIEAKISMQYDIPTWESAHRFLTRHGADLRNPRHWLALFERCVVCAGARFFQQPSLINWSMQSESILILKTFLRNHMLYIFLCDSLLLIVSTVHKLLYF